MGSPKPVKLDLSLLARKPGMPALTAARGRSFAEAAAVCLDHHRHRQGVSLTVEGATCEYVLEWPRVTKKTRRAYDDPIDATHEGAYAVAILLASHALGLKALQRARQGTGFDYWLGKRVSDLFQRCTRLEVSGILRGTESQIRARVQVKREQTRQSDELKLPAYVCVVEFGCPESRLVKKR